VEQQIGQQRLQPGGAQRRNLHARADNHERAQQVNLQMLHE